MSWMSGIFSVGIAAWPEIKPEQRDVEIRSSFILRFIIS